MGLGNEYTERVPGRVAAVAEQKATPERKALPPVTWDHDDWLAGR